MIPWTERDDAKLEKLWTDGVTPFEEIVGAFSGRSEGEIESRARLLNLAPGIFRIKDRIWDVGQTEIALVVDKSGELSWYFEAQADEKVFGGEVWQPRAYIEKYPISLSYPIPFPDGLQNEVLQIPQGSALSNWLLPGGQNACLYVFEHEWLNEISIKFLGQKGPFLDIEWSARCNVGWDKKYSTDLEMCILAPMEFRAIWVEERNKAKATRLVSRYFDVSGMTFTTSEDPTHGAFLLPSL